MKLEQATMDRFAEILSFYDLMCRVLAEKDFLPNGDQGGFPSPDMVKGAIASGPQFIGIEGGKIVAAYIMNHDCDDAYHTVQWQIDAAPDEVVILHALRVLPDYGGRGFSKQLVEHAIRTAQKLEPEGDPPGLHCGKRHSGIGVPVFWLSICGYRRNYLCGYWRSHAIQALRARFVRKVAAVHTPAPLSAVDTPLPSQCRPGRSPG